MNKGGRFWFSREELKIDQPPPKMQEDFYSDGNCILRQEMNVLEEAWKSQHPDTVAMGAVDILDR